MAGWFSSTSGTGSTTRTTGINASNKSLYLLVDPLFGANVDVTQLPPHVRDLIAEFEREHGDIRPTCELVRAVAIEGWCLALGWSPTH